MKQQIISPLILIIISIFNPVFKNCRLIREGIKLTGKYTECDLSDK